MGGFSSASLHQDVHTISHDAGNCCVLGPRKPLQLLLLFSGHPNLDRHVFGFAHVVVSVHRKLVAGSDLDSRLETHYNPLRVALNNRQHIAGSVPSSRNRLVCVPHRPNRFHFGSKHSVRFVLHALTLPAWAQCVHNYFDLFCLRFRIQAALRVRCFSAHVAQWFRVTAGFPHWRHFPAVTCESAHCF
jgi:hypothetical protein